MVRNVRELQNNNKKTDNDHDDKVMRHFVFFTEKTNGQFANSMTDVQRGCTPAKFRGSTPRTGPS